MMHNAEFYVAVDNKGLWPNVTLLPSGEIVAAAYNKPSHGFGCGNVDMWVSNDEVKIWEYRSTVSDHSEHPEHVRMNKGVGLNMHGEIVALVSGWSEGRQLPLLDVQICISKDQGRTWERSHWKPEASLVPFGSIVQQPDGTLTASLYGKESPDGDPNVYTYRSEDHGRTWGDHAFVIANCGETTLLRCRNGSWLAGSNRKSNRYENLSYGGTQVILSKSDDEGQSWQEVGPITLPGQKPGDLLELNDGRIVLTYGSRIIGLSGVCARISEDQGSTWSVARPLVTAPGPMDCGYPSSVELRDGTIVTAYYGGPREKGYGDPKKGYGAWAKAPYSFPWHQRYHMGVCRWRPEMLAEPLDQIIIGMK